MSFEGPNYSTQLCSTCLTPDDCQTMLLRAASEWQAVYAPGGEIDLTVPQAQDFDRQVARSIGPETYSEAIRSLRDQCYDKIVQLMDSVIELEPPCRRSGYVPKEA